MLALAPRRFNHPMDREELMSESSAFHNDHFTPGDRRELIETGVKLSNLKEDFAELKMIVQSSQEAARSAVDRVAEAARTAVDKVAGENRATIDRLEVRIRQLENFRWWIVGAAASAGIGGSFLARFFHQ